MERLTHLTGVRRSTSSTVVEPPPPAGETAVAGSGKGPLLAGVHPTSTNRSLEVFAVGKIGSSVYSVIHTVIHQPLLQSPRVIPSHFVARVPRLLHIARGPPAAASIASLAHRSLSLVVLLAPPSPLCFLRDATTGVLFWLNTHCAE